MKKKIAILGSTGSIGKSTLEVINMDRKNFQVVLLTANNNYKKLIEQAKKFKAENVIIRNNNFYLRVKKSLNKTKTKVYHGNPSLKKILNKKVDYTISAIVGLAGLQPTIDAIKTSKAVALANKESIICGWEILSSYVKRYNTQIIPVDSEHFSIMELTNNISDDEVKEIIITASGGPFLKTPIKKLKKVKPKQAIKHPNWKMGKKISVDSANLMNKVFEVLEASKIFNFASHKYKILIHPQSYIHSIINFNNGLVKIISYNPDMKIPISNILHGKKNNFLNNKKIDSKILNNINLEEVNESQFPAIKLINKCLNLGPSTTIIVNASNEVLVDLYLKGKIEFLDIVKGINRILRDKEFRKYARRKASSLNALKIIDNWARLKTVDMCVR